MGIVTSVEVDRSAEGVFAYDRPRLTISVDFSGHGVGKILVPLVVHREASVRRGLGEVC